MVPGLQIWIVADPSSTTPTDKVVSSIATRGTTQPSFFDKRTFLHGIPSVAL